MGRRWLHSVDLETDENGRPLIESNVAALAAALTIPMVGAELGALTMTGRTKRLGVSPVRVADAGDQLDTVNLDEVLGLTAANTTAGHVFFKVVDDTGGFRHLELYKESARTTLVAHTATYNSTGAKALVADGASGVGGYVTVKTVGAPSALVEYSFTLAQPCKNVFVKPQTLAVGGGVNAAVVLVGYAAPPTAYELVPADKGYLIAFADVCGLYVTGTAADKIYVTYKN